MATVEAPTFVVASPWQDLHWWHAYSSLHPYDLVLRRAREELGAHLLALCAEGHYYLVRVVRVSDDGSEVPPRSVYDRVLHLQVRWCQAKLA